MIKFKRSKNKRTWLLNSFLFVVLPIYIGISIAGVAAILLVLEFARPDNGVAYAMFGCFFGYMLGAPLLFLFFGLPKMKVHQAMLDLKKYDFSPYEADGDIEFEALMPAATYCYEADPFDKDEHITLCGREAAEMFAGSIADRCIGIEEADTRVFLPFFINDKTPDERLTIYDIYKSVEGDILKLKVAQLCRLTFTQRGIVVGQSLTEYADVGAACGLWLDRDGVQARVAFELDGSVASFAVGTKIYAAIQRFCIKVENGDVLKFIMDDPQKAFKAVAKTLNFAKQADFTLK